MKKLIALIMILALNSNVYANVASLGYQTTPADSDLSVFVDTSGNNRTTTFEDLKSSFMSGLPSDSARIALPSLPTNSTFRKDFTTTNITSANADSSSGSATATFAATRSATTPATYITLAGVITTTTTSSVPRFTNGYYDELGFHARRAILVEAAATNQIIQSAQLSDAAWVASNVTVATNTVGDPAGTSLADTLTASANNATLTQTYTGGSTSYAASIFLKRKTGTSPIFLSIDNGTTLVSCDVKDTVNWVRCQVNGVTTNPTLKIVISANADAVYAWGGQLETGYYNTSYIPTTTVGLTRNAETLKYPTAGNLTASGQTIFIKMTPEWGGNDTAANLNLFDTDTKRQLIQLNTTTDTLQFYPNFTDSSSNLSTSVGNIDRNKSMIFTASYSQATPTSSAYVDGFQDASSTNAITTPAWGTSFYVGMTNAGAGGINAMIEEVRIYSGSLTQAQVFAVCQDMGIKRKINLLPLGDSITAGRPDTLEVNWSYRKKLQVYLGNKYLLVGNKALPTYNSGAVANGDPGYFTNFTVRNAGVSGETTAQILARVPANLSQYFVDGTYNRGSGVLIHAGTNDITLDALSDLGLSITAAITNIKSMIDLIDARDSELNVFVCKLIPRYDTSANFWYTQRFNEELERTRITWAKKNVYIVDMQAAFRANSKWKTEYMYDDKHPNDIGYDVMARVYSGAIKDTLNLNPLVRNDFSAYAAGTVYSLTNTAALVDFGTTDPVTVINQPGRYVLSGGAQLKYNATTFAGNQTATCKITRLNNTPADITNATRTIDLAIVTTITDNAGYVQIPTTYYDTAFSNDVLALYCSVSATPGAGTVDATSAEITAIRRY